MSFACRISKLRMRCACFSLANSGDCSPSSMFLTGMPVKNMDEGEQSPEFASEKQAQRILSLLIRHANDIALTLIEASQHYEPLFFKRDVKGRTVSIVDEWCCGYVKGLALDSLGWQPLIEARPD